MKLSIVSDQISQDYREAFSVIRDYGMRYVELHNVNNKSIENISEKELKELKISLREHELEVSSLGTTLFLMAKLEDDYEISPFNEVFRTFDGEIDDHLKQLERACYIANELDTELVRVFPFRYPDNVAVKDFIRVKHRVSEIMKEAAEIAARYGIVLVLENCPYTLMPKGQMTKEVVDEVNSANLKLLYDIGNSYRADTDKVPAEYNELSLFEETRLIRDDVAHVHLKDYKFDESFEAKPFRHIPLMDGDIDLVEFLSYLYMTDYEGYVSLETGVDYEGTLKSMNAVKSFIEKTSDKIFELEKEGAENHHKRMNCSQSTAVALMPLISDDVDLACRVMEGFGSGMGIHSTCGALSGMNAIISMSSSAGIDGYLNSKRKTEADVKMMMEIFLRSYDSVNCSDIKIDMEHCDMIISKCCRLAYLYLLMKHRTDVKV